MADEVTDSSNKEQFVVCLRWVDHDNLSKTLQDAHISASEGHAVSSLTVKTLEKMRSDDHFNLFWEIVTHKANALEVSEPSLPCRRKRPACYESGSAIPEFVDNAQD